MKRDLTSAKPLSTTASPHCLGSAILTIESSLQKMGMVTIIHHPSDFFVQYGSLSVSISWQYGGLGESGH